MPWFKVDDTLHSHPKARRAGPAAMGLWALAGAYSSAYKLDGFVPDDYVRTWPSGRRLASLLVCAEMWDAGEKDGDPGWWFHDWDDYQETSEQIERVRELARERQRRRREAQIKAREEAVTNV